MATTTPADSTTIKFQCSLGGKLVPRPLDGKLRYHGGQTRVLTVNRSISHSELLTKLGRLSHEDTTVMILRCQLPEVDLDDAMVNIVSDEDLASLIEEYDRVATSRAASSSLKIRAFLSSPRKISPDEILSSSSSSSSSSSTSSSSHTFDARLCSSKCFNRRVSKTTTVASPARKVPRYGYVYDRNNWQ